MQNDNQNQQDQNI